MYLPLTESYYIKQSLKLIYKTFEKSIWKIIHVFIKVKLMFFS